jgi:hypothetical protein
MYMLDWWSLTRSIPKSTRVLAVLATCGTLTFLLRCFPLWTLTSMTLGLGLVALNYPFYRFLAMQRQPLFAAVVVPLHVTYYLYSGLAFGIGLCLYLAKAKTSWPGYGSSRPPQKIEEECGFWHGSKITRTAALPALPEPVAQRSCSAAGKGASG